jgi:hypothetical protein
MVVYIRAFRKYKRITNKLKLIQLVRGRVSSRHRLPECATSVSSMRAYFPETVNMARTISSVALIVLLCKRAKSRPSPMDQFDARCAESERVGLVICFA